VHCFNTLTPYLRSFEPPGAYKLTSLVLFPLFMYQWLTIEVEVAQRFWTRKTWILLTASGLALAAHFGAWVASLDETTPHPLPAVCNRSPTGDCGRYVSLGTNHGQHPPTEAKRSAWER
jgi:hypothetical protein